MKLLRSNTRSILTLSLAGMLGITAISCIGPVYQTASVSPGFSLTAGGGPSVVSSWDCESTHTGWYEVYDTAARFEVDFNIGISNRFACIGHMGVISSTGKGYNGGLLAGAALQYQIFEAVPFALQAGMQPFPSISLLGGIPLKDRELITGGIGAIFIPHPQPSYFLTIHPLRWLHLSIAQTPSQEYHWGGGELHLGLGLTFIDIRE